MLGAKETLYPANEKWSYRAFSGWHQDVDEWRDEKTGEVFPPTFSWFATFQGTRVNQTPEAGHFYLRIRISGEQGKPLDRYAANLAEERGNKEFDSFADCACVIGKNCAKHGGELVGR